MPAHFDYLLIPGFDGTGTLFAPLIDTGAFPSRPDVMTYPRSLRSVSDLARSQSGPQRAWDRTVIIAESMGGLVAAELCARLARQPAALILCAAFATSPNPLLLTLAELVPIALQRWCATSPALLRRFCFDGDAEPRALALLRSANTHVGNAEWRARLRILRSCDVRVQLRALRAPACYLQAASDRLVPASASDECCAQLADLTRIELPGPHFLLQSAPMACMNAIARFLASVPRR